MNDHELLELAAKAAGIDLVEYSKQLKDDWIDFWNPLTNDGDALRLAIKLRINIRFSLCSGFVSAACPFKGPEESVGSDPYAATRRAIVRAAAEIEKEMK